MFGVAFASAIVAQPILADAGPSNDTIANATVATAGTYTADQSTVGATTSPGENLNCHSMGATVWYRVDTTARGIVSASVVTGVANPDGTTTGMFSPAIAMYYGSDSNNLSRLGCEGSLGNAENIGGASLPAGTYWIQIGGENGTGGALHVEIDSQAVGDPDDGNPSGAIVESDGCSQQSLPRNDDGSSSTSVDLPFTLDFYGSTYSHLWVNNNGNVTFDGPLSTFTPFGLTGTSSVIIAPFFADVDTRNLGSDQVQYGYGTTLYQGHTAFCVDWVNVGYYNQHADKLNSAQLLLVQREDIAPGAFDIVFNYGTVNWETGDASGGIDGLGGSSAVAGFSNGSGSVNTSYELPGSAINGGLLDTNPVTGLVNNLANSSQLGRYVYTVRAGSPPPNTYVAMGDSYQSGEGTGDYYPQTDSDSDKCHRSSHAYAPTLVARGTLPYKLDFVACSGATTQDLKQDGTAVPQDNPPYTEDSQYAHIDGDTALVTIGIGGNDMGFGNIVSDCVINDTVFNGTLDPCSNDDGGKVDSAFVKISGPDPDEPSSGLNYLQHAYAEILKRAPRARVLVVGYPRFFPVDGGRGNSTYIPGLGIPAQKCAGINQSDQSWINYEIARVDNLIAQSAASMGVEYVDTYDIAGDDHALCQSDPSVLNSVTIPKVGSFHPTAYGQGLIADRVTQELNTLPPNVATYRVYPGQTLTGTYTVPPNTPTASFSTSWPGSDVVMSLRSPSGRVITRSTTDSDVYHLAGPTHELYKLTDPEPGTWTVSLFGANVSTLGEQTLLTSYIQPQPNQNPTANVVLSQSDRTVTLDATGSVDPDGQIARYEWDFGDGTGAFGATATHTYSAGGVYRPTLTVIDDQGAPGYGAASTTVTITSDDPTSLGTADKYDAVLLGANANFSNDQVCGDVAVTAGATLTNQAPSTISGNLYEASTGAYKGPGHLTGSVITDPSAVSQAVSDALDASTAAASLSPTYTFGNVTTSIAVGGGSGLTVVDVTGDLNLNNASLTLQGSAASTFIINVAGSVTLGGAGGIQVAGGALPSNVLVNMTGSGKTINTHIGNVVQAKLLGPSVGGSLNGAFGPVLLGRSFSLMGGVKVGCF